MKFFKHGDDAELLYDFYRCVRVSKTELFFLAVHTQFEYGHTFGVHGPAFHYAAEVNCQQAVAFYPHFFVYQALAYEVFYCEYHPTVYVFFIPLPPGTWMSMSTTIISS